MLTLKDATVTFDVMGCRKEIARKIVDNEGHYLMALKGNQGSRGKCGGEPGPAATSRSDAA